MEFSQENPENKEQESEFVAEVNTLPKHVREDIIESLKQHELGQTISLEEFKKRHFTTPTNTNE